MRPKTLALESGINVSHKATFLEINMLLCYLWEKKKKKKKFKLFTVG